MSVSDGALKPPRVLNVLPFYYGWIVVALTFLANFAASGIRSAPSVLIHPLEAEFGWSRTAIASAASLNLLLYGLAAPLGGWLIDRIGPRRVVLGSLVGMVLGLAGAVFVRDLAQFVFVWGIVLGLAIGVTPSLAASVASRWFIARRGLALGVLTNANAAGQMVFLPLLMAVVMASGWRSSLLVVLAAAAALVPLVFLWMRDQPAEIGILPDGSKEETDRRRKSIAHGDDHLMATPLLQVFRSSTFWLAAGCFFVCGVTANGLIGTHLIPHAIERGIPQVTAAAAVGIMGGASFVGTTFAGWLVDRVDPRKVLAAAYALRGSSLLILPYVSESLGLFAFAVMYGLDWFASGPPTTTILARSFGYERVGRLFGLVFVFHQLGAAVAAVGGGWARVQFGDYEYAFLAGGLMALIAAAMALMIRTKRRPEPEISPAVEFANA